MSNNTPYHQFIRVAKLDQQLILDLSKVDLLKSQINELNNKIEDADKNLSISNQLLVSLKKKVDDSQLELKNLDDQEFKKKQNLLSVKNPKQFEFLSHEIEVIKNSKDKIEDNLLSWFNEVEKLSDIIEIKKIDFEKFKALANLSIKEKSEILDSLEKSINNIKNEEQIILEILPEDWVEKYKKMKRNVSNPVVPVFSNSCSVCFAELTAATINALKHNKLVNCPDCYRLLYIEEK